MNDNIDFANLGDNFKTGFSRFLSAMNASTLTVTHSDYFEALKMSVAFWINVPYYMDPGDEPCNAISRASSPFARDVLFLADLATAFSKSNSIFLDTNTRFDIYSKCDFNRWFDLIVQYPEYWDTLWEATFPKNTLTSLTKSEMYVDFESFLTAHNSHMLTQIAVTMNTRLNEVISNLSKKTTIIEVTINSDLTL